MGVRHEQFVDEVFVLDAGGRLAPSAAALRLVVGNRLRLGVTAMGQGHHHILRGNQIFRRQVFVIDEDFRAPLIAEGVADIFELVANHFEQTLRAGQDVGKIPNLFQQFLELGNDLVLLEPCEPVKAHLQNCLRLRLRQSIAARDDAESRDFTVGPGADGAGTRQHLWHGA